MKEFDKPLRTSPFIKLLRSPHSGYFYDVNRNEIIPIDDDVYTYLDKLLKDGVEDGAEATLGKVAELKENGYLSNNRVKEIKHPMTDYIEDILERNVQKITLQLTQNCNFMCSYCVYSQKEHKNRIHSSNSISEDVIIKAINFLKNHSKDLNSVNIGFYGGEPLLEFDKIKFAVREAKRILIGKEVTYTITTNASLLSEEILQFFEKEKFSILLSIDGPKSIHDKNRIFKRSKKGTFETVIKNVDNIYNNHRDMIKRIRVNMVMDPQNDFDDINDIFNANPLFKECDFSSTIIDDLYLDLPNEFEDKFISKYIYNQFLSYLVYAKIIKSKSVSPILMKNLESSLIDKDRRMINSQLPSKAVPSGVCISGRNRLFINYTGIFYPCEKVSETSTAMQIGSLDNGFDYPRICEHINVSQKTSELCMNCWAFMHCELCVKHSDANFKLDGHVRAKNCKSVERRIESKFKSFILTDDLQNKLKHER